MKGDGNCMPNAMLEQISFDDDPGSEELFTQMYLRRQAVRHLIQHWDALGASISEDIKMQYGRIDSEINGKPIRKKRKVGKDVPPEEYGFSVSEWCYKIISNRFWCDEIFIKIVSSMWGCRITVVRSDCLQEIRYRHDLPLEQADIILLYNCNPWVGHYSAIVNCGEELMYNSCEISPVRFSENYRKHDDLDERLNRGDVTWDLDNEKRIFTAKRGYKFVKEDDQDKKKKKGDGDDQDDDKGSGGVKIGEDEIVVKRDEWDDLKRKVKDLEAWKRKVDELEVQVERLKEDRGDGLLVTEKNIGILKDSVLKLGRNLEAVTQGKDPDELDIEVHVTPRKRKQPDQPPTPELAKMVKKKRLDVERNVPEDVGDVETGESYCKICECECGSSTALASHHSKFHKNEYIYSCEECGKGFMTKQGYEAHVKGHKSEDRLKCPRGCSKTFVSKGAVKKHMDQIHKKKPKDYQKPTCQYCQKKFAAKGNLTEHIKSCSKNPDRVPIYCEVCKQSLITG